MNVFDLVATITLDSSGYSAELGKAKSEGESFSSSIGGGIGSALGNAAKLGAAAVAGATTAIIGFAGAAVETGKSFDSSMSQVYATMGDKAKDMIEYNGKTVSSMEALRDFAQQMGASTAFSASEAADALNYMALAGYDAQTSMNMLPNVLNLAAAGGMDLARASDMVTDAQSALGLSLEDTTTMVDQIAKASSSSNASVEQFGDAILQIGATARGIKGGTVELTTVLGVLADNGIKGAEGGTHLRNMLLSLQTPTKSGTEALEKLGLAYKDMYDSAGNMRSLPEIMLDLQKRMEGMTQASKDAIISGLFNKFDLAAANALIGTSAERYDSLTNAITDSKGAAEDMKNTQLDNLAGDITILKSAFEGFQIAVSDEVTPTLRSFVQLGSEGLSEMTKAFKEGGIEGAIDAFQGILTKGLDMIVKGLPKAIEVGVQLLGAIVKGLSDALPTLGEAGLQIMTMLGEYIVEGIPKVIAAIPQVISAFYNGLSAAIPQLLSSGIEMINSITQGIRENSGTIIDAVLEGIDKMSQIGAENLEPALNAGLELVVALVEGIGENLPKIVEKSIELLDRFLGNLIEGDSLERILDAGIRIISALLEGIVKSIPLIIEEAGKLIGTIVEKFNETDWEQVGKDVIEKIKQGITFLSEEIPKILKEIGETAGNLIGSVDWKKVGKDIITKIGEGIKFLVENVPKALRAIAENGRDLFSKVDWVGVGTNVINSIINGIKTLIESIPSLIKSIGDTASDWIRNIDWNQVGYDVITYILNGLQFMFYDIPNTLGEILENAKDTVNNIDWLQLGLDIVQGIIDGVGSLADTLIDTVSDMAEGAWNAIKDFFDVNSPSKKMMWLGEMVDKGLSKGIEDSADLVENSMDNISVIPEVDTSSYEAGIAGGTSDNTNNSITINVYGAAGQDINELAEIIEQKINAATKRREGAFA